VVEIWEIDSIQSWSLTKWKIRTIGPHHDLGYHKLEGERSCLPKPRVMRSRNNEVGPFRELGYHELGGRVLCASNS
jgi:hypothetical protein